MAKEKIAILGGGVGGMTAALWLSEPQFRDRYEVTVYQMGWRCGGKGASGRNLDAGYGKRSEEHGLHIWFGFYENAFKSIRKAYKAIGKHGPFNAWNEAFLPATEGTVADFHDGQWDFWKLVFEPEPGTPGDGAALPDLGEYMRRALVWIVENIERHPDLRAMLETPDHNPASHGGIIGAIVRTGRKLVDDFLLGAANAAAEFPTFAHNALMIMQRIPVLGPATAHLIREAHSEMEKFLLSVRDLIIRREQLGGNLRRLLIMLDFGATCVLGALRDNVLTDGLDKLDEEDFCAWMKRHGAFHTTLESSPMLKGLYDVPFAFTDGDCSKPNFGAGTALRCLMKMMFGYKGAFVWKLQSGMGEIVFTPYYKALVSRGVKFKFFHKATSLGIDPATQSIGTIDMDVQARTKDGTDYQPLIPVKVKDADGSDVDFWCWPDRPLADQLATPVPAIDKASFESQFNTTPPVEKLTLRAGADFDKVIVATSIHGLRTIAAELIAKDPAWRAMIDNVKAIRTQSVQLWMTPSLKELGWDPHGHFTEGALVDAFKDDINTWMDQKVVLKTEQWPDGAKSPRHLVYFCGPIKEDPKEPPLNAPASTLENYPATQTEKVRADAMPWLDENASAMWPRAVTGKLEKFDWKKAFDPEDRVGAKRSLGQFYRANIDPQERYVLTVAGSTKHRLHAGGSGFANLFLAGDWTLNGLNVGAVEGATMSGMQAARAICGEPHVIPGETDL